MFMFFMFFYVFYLQVNVFIIYGVDNYCV